eukprot:maker-scaffold_16-snap-gene-6.25-mRNA-1 protein AED:0.92 eAED:0.92 QI:0/0/0/0.5/1/1/2/0/175
MQQVDSFMSKPIWRKEDIVYFKRMNIPELRSEKLAHLKSVASEKELSRIYPTIRWKEIEHGVFRITALVEKDDMLGKVIEELDIVFKAKIRLWQSIVWKQENFKIPERFHFDGQRFAVTLDGENNRISLSVTRFEAQYHIFPKLSRPLYYGLEDPSYLKEFILKNGLMFQGAVVD